MFSNEVNSAGLPTNLINTTLVGRTLTAQYYERYQNALTIDPNQNNKIVVSGLENSVSNAGEILQFWQYVENWGLYYPESVTPVVQRLMNVLLKLRKATPTDAPYSFYELLLFWNIALRPDYFAPVVFSDSIYNSLIINALEYEYEILYTTVQNLINRSKNPDTPLVSVTDSFPEYQIPQLPAISTPPTVEPEKKKSSWPIYLLIGICVFYFLSLKD